MYKTWYDFGDEYEYFNDSETLAEAIIENLDNEPFDEMLDSGYDDIEICGASYSVSNILYNTDPVAYRCYMSDYYNELRQDIVYELEHMTNGETDYIFYINVECIDEEEETA